MYNSQPRPHPQHTRVNTNPYFNNSIRALTHIVFYPNNLLLHKVYQSLSIKLLQSETPPPIIIDTKPYYYRKLFCD